MITFSYTRRESAVAMMTMLTMRRITPAVRRVMGPPPPTHFHFPSLPSQLASTRCKPTRHHLLFSLTLSFFPFSPRSMPAPLFVCRQCPSYVDPVAPPPAAAPSHPAPPPFSCTPSTSHVLCMCCLQPMPDRRHDSDMSIPPQKCTPLHSTVQSVCGG